MNYQAFTNESLTMMYNGVRGALAADDALSDLGAECKFRVRQTPGWKVHAASLEAEMLKRKMFFELIDWSENQTRSPSRNEQARIERPGYLKPEQVGMREKWCLEWADECSSVHGIQVNDGGRRTLAGAIASALQRASLTLTQLAKGGVTSTLFLPGSGPVAAAVPLPQPLIG